MGKKTRGGIAVCELWDEEGALNRPHRLPERSRGEGDSGPEQRTQELRFEKGIREAVDICGFRAQKPLRGG